MGSIPTSRPNLHSPLRVCPPGWLNGRVTVIPIQEKNQQLHRDSGELPGWLKPFEPRSGLANAHLQTIAGNFYPRPALQLAALPETVEVDPSDGSRVLCHCHWQAEPANHLTLVLVHGLESSSQAGYLLSMAQAALAISEGAAPLA